MGKKCKSKESIKARSRRRRSLKKNRHNSKSQRITDTTNEIQTDDSLSTESFDGMTLNSFTFIWKCIKHNMYIHAILVLIVIMFTSHLDYAYLCCCQTALNHFLIKRLNSEPSKSHVSFSVVLQKGKYAYDVKCALLKHVIIVPFAQH